MPGKKRAELLGGFALAALGGTATAYSLTHYQLGTLRQIGPGFLPVMLGMALVGLGLLIAWVARPAPNAETRGFRAGNVAAITLSVVAFALLIERAGYVVAVFAAVLIATQPWDRGGVPLRLAIAAVTTLFVGLVFGLGLDMPIHAFPG